MIKKARLLKLKDHYDPYFITDFANCGGYTRTDLYQDFDKLVNGDRRARKSITLTRKKVLAKCFRKMFPHLKRDGTRVDEMSDIEIVDFMFEEI